MSDINEQIDAIEKEIRETPYHKGTEHHIGRLRARLAKLKDRIIEGEHIYRRQVSGISSGFALRKTGDATVVLVGPPSSGKSTLINKLTNAKSKVAPYAFTTVTVIPGMMDYKDAKIQILDVPGLIEGAKEGKGRGKEVLSVVRGADLLIIMSDVQKLELIDMTLNELQKAGVRINEERPKIKINKKLEGGLAIYTNIKQEMSEGVIKEIVREFGLTNADIILNENVSMNRLIDTLSPNRVYIPAIFVINKIDLNKNQQYRSSNYGTKVIKISAETGEGLENLKEEIWKGLELTRIYLVKPDEEPSKNNPLIVKSSDTLNNVASKLGEKFLEKVSLAKIWGPGARFPGQEVSLATKVQEGMQVRFY